MLDLRDIEARVVDDRTKGVPPGARLAISEFGNQGWNLLAGDLPLPVAVLKQSALNHNSRWMVRFAEERQAVLAPHVKTTMAPQIIKQQLEDGCWALTVATVRQMELLRRMGAQRIILANQPVCRMDVAQVVRALQDDETFEFFCLADSDAGATLLEAAAREAGLNRPVNVLLELGFTGGRTGVRTAAEALALARRLKASPHLRLAGVEGFEGLLTSRGDGAEAAVRGFLGLMTDVFDACAAEGLFERTPPLLTAGGSAFHDMVAAAFRGRCAQVVLRSGCYISHDHGLYARAQGDVMMREGLCEGLMPALELWGMVQSVPEPGFAVVTGGRRDAGFDAGLPRPLWLSRAGAMPERLPDGLATVGMSDHHLHVAKPEGVDLRVGDMIGFGVSHPCTTFDKWQVIPVVGDDYRVTGAVATFF